MDPTKMNHPSHIQQRGEWDCLFTCLMMFGVNKRQLLKVCQEAVIEIFLPHTSLAVLDQKPTWLCTPGLATVKDPSIAFIRIIADHVMERHVIVLTEDDVFDPWLTNVVSRDEWLKQMKGKRKGCTFYTETVIRWLEGAKV